MANSTVHESLLDAKILHRDISIGNVMLTIAEDDGFLIDLDLVVKIDCEGASGAPSKTGMKVFMATGALYGEDHNFMHDWESFFGYCSGLVFIAPGPGGNLVSQSSNHGILSVSKTSQRSRKALWMRRTSSTRK
jgi:hypothetical protein